MKKLAATVILTLGLLIACYATLAGAAAAHSHTAGRKAHHKVHRTRCGAAGRKRHHKQQRTCRRSRRARVAGVRHAPTARAHDAGTPVSSPGPNPSLQVSCDLYAAPSGSDSNGDGSISAPFATVEKLDEALQPGQTGCLRAGSYGGLTTWQDLGNDGNRGAQITITSYPGETATIRGWVDMEASYMTLENVRIDGSNTLYKQHPSGVNCRDNVSQALAIEGENDTLQYVNFFQSVPQLRGVGIGVGFGTGGDNAIVRYNEVHDVGGCDFYDHLIYLSGARNVQIYDNWMWNDPHGWGIKLDPGPQNARIWGNVIDRAGSGFNFGNSSGDTPTAGNQVFDNIVINSVGVSNPDIRWSHPGVLVTSPGLMSQSTGNRVDDNDYFNNPGGVSEIAGVRSSQLALHGNTSARPQFVNAAAHDYALVSSSLQQFSGLVRQ